MKQNANRAANLVAPAAGFLAPARRCSRVGSCNITDVIERALAPADAAASIGDNIELKVHPRP